MTIVEVLVIALLAFIVLALSYILNKIITIENIVSMIKVIVTKDSQ